MTDDSGAVGPDGGQPDDPPVDAVSLDADDSDPAEVSSTRRNIAVGAVVLVALIVAAVVAALFWPSDASGYTAEVESNFMVACTADGGDDVEPVCACLYAEIVETIPYDRFEEVNDALETGQAAAPDSPAQLPADFDEIRQTCVERHGSPPSTTSTTAAADVESTTTAVPETATTAPPASSTAPPAPAAPPAVSPAPPALPPPPPRSPSPAPSPSPGGGGGGLAP